MVAVLENTENAISSGKNKFKKCKSLWLKRRDSTEIVAIVFSYGWFEGTAQCKYNKISSSKFEVPRGDDCSQKALGIIMNLFL